MICRIYIIDYTSCHENGGRDERRRRLSDIQELTNSNSNHLYMPGIDGYILYFSASIAATEAAGVREEEAAIRDPRAEDLE